MEQLGFRFAVPPATRRRFVRPGQLINLERQWSDRFREHFRYPFRVVFNDNTSTMISSRTRRGRLQIRLHHMFLEADEVVLEALSQYLTGSNRGNRRLDRFIEKNMNRVARRRLAKVGGAVYDLEAIRDALNRAYFEDPVQVPVIWSSRRSSRRQRSIRLGSYSFEDRVIRVHPVLDQEAVPPSVVVGVVYHEMLHHALGARTQHGRRVVHTREFREQEARFVHHRRVNAWEKENLPRLLRRAGRSQA